MMLQAVFETRLKDMTMAVPLMCCAADMVSVPSRKQVVIVGHKPSLELDNMLAAAHAAHDPNKTVSTRISISNPLTSNSCFGVLCLVIPVYLSFMLRCDLLHFTGNSHRSYRR